LEPEEVEEDDGGGGGEGLETLLEANDGAPISVAAATCAACDASDGGGSVGCGAGGGGIDAAALFHEERSSSLLPPGGGDEEEEVDEVEVDEVEVDDDFALLDARARCSGSIGHVVALARSPRRAPDSSRRNIRRAPCCLEVLSKAGWWVEEALGRSGADGKEKG
jgi:hypothetical protein